MNCWFGGTSFRSSGKKAGTEASPPSGNRHERKPSWSDKNEKGRWRAYDYQELTKRDKLNLDIFWLKDDSLEDSANLPDPDIIAADLKRQRRSKNFVFVRIT